MRKLLKNIKSRWQKLTDDLIGSKDYFLIDAPVYSFFKIIKYPIDKYAKGKVLDAGTGRLTLKFLLNNMVLIILMKRTQN